MKKSLTVCIPTNRKLDEAYSSISSAIEFCKSNEAELIISDNSDDENKQNLLSNKQSNYLKYFFGGPKIAIENWYNAVSKSTSLYTLILSDDDLILNIARPDYAYEEAKKNNIIGIKPIISCWNQKVGIYRNNTFQLEEEDPLDRILGYRKKYGGDNTSMYSFFDTQILKDLLFIFLSHPTRGGYTDWAFMHALISSGKIFHDQSKLLIYKNNNWFGDKKFIKKNEINLYKKAGLTERGVHFSMLFRALDVFILILRESSPINRKLLLVTAKSSFIFYLKVFLQYFNNNMNCFMDKEILQINKINLENNLEKNLEVSILIIESFLNGLSKKYLLFYKKSIGTDWGILK